MIGSWNSFFDAWAEVMIRASLQGALAVVLVILICQLFGKWSSSRTECWLWRLVFLKLLLIVIWVAPIKVPILPVSTEQPTASSVASELGSDVTDWQTDSKNLHSSQFESQFRMRAGNDGKPAKPIQGGGIVNLEKKNESTSIENLSRKSGEPSIVAGFRALDFAGVLLFCWLAGVTLCAGWTVIAWASMRRIQQSCIPLADVRIVDCCKRLCKQFAIEEMPKVVASPLTTSPLLMGLRQPKIVFPAAMLGKLSDEQVEMVLAHELSHLKRNDLWWSWIPLIVQTLFFFHPLVWLARERWLLSREMACDELVLSVTKKSAVCYADALVNVSSCMQQKTSHSRADMAFGSTCMVQKSFSLKRRIKAMKNFTEMNPVSTQAIMMFTFAALLAVLPWQPVEREVHAVDSPVAPVVSATSPPAVSASPIQPIPVLDGRNLDFEEGASQGSPKGWFGGGRGYELTASSDARSGEWCGQVKQVGNSPKNSFGSLTSGFKAAPYHGKRLRYRGYLKSDMEQDAWAGLWMRIDGESGSIGFDNMKSRPVKGKTDWTEYSVIIDVPNEAKNITFGFLISGKGTLWGDDLSFDIVGKIGEGPEVTDMYKDGKTAYLKKAMKQPALANLDFESGAESGKLVGWFGGGKGFKVELDTENARSGKGCVRLKRVKESGRFSGNSQRVSAVPFRGKKIRLTGFVKTKDATVGGAGLWMRIDGPNRNTLGFDNMGDRPILGSTEWTQYAIEMDVPENSTYVTFGILLKGGGVAWADDFNVETVDAN